MIPLIWGSPQIESTKALSARSEPSSSPSAAPCALDLRDQISGLSMLVFLWSGVNPTPYEPLNPKPCPRDPSVQIIPTLDPKVYKHYLHWAIWILTLKPKTLELLALGVGFCGPEFGIWGLKA